MNQEGERVEDYSVNRLTVMANESYSEFVLGLQNGTITPEQAAISYDYTAPLVMLASLGVAALILGFILKAVDKKKGLGLEEPNIK